METYCIFTSVKGLKFFEFTGSFSNSSKASNPSMTLKNNYITLKFKDQFLWLSGVFY